MPQHYHDPRRSADVNALPDLEVFLHPDHYDLATDEDGEPYPNGWYYWACSPGCLPDSDPVGPFTSERAALRAARED